jgi:hypothetical protein
MILWDVQTHQRIGSPLPGHTRRVLGIAFRPDGETLLSGSDDHRMVVRDWDAVSWTQKTCQRAGRNFTNEEWKQYFPGQEYRKTCEQFPRHLSYYQAMAKNLLSNVKEPEQLQKALDSVSGAMESDSAIYDPSIAAKKLVSEFVANRIQAMPTSSPQEILDLLKQAEANQLVLTPFISDPNFLNGLCWYGALQGYAPRILEYCDQAVDLAPGDQNIRDSRGVARALTGNPAGAIEDFQFFVANDDRVESTRQRQQWITDLKAGRNPFTPELLEELMGE